MLQLNYQKNIYKLTKVNRIKIKNKIIWIKIIKILHM